MTGLPGRAAPLAPEGDSDGGPAGAPIRLPQGEADWFRMVGTLICQAVLRSGLSPQVDLSLIERYSDGQPLSDGLIQGLRIDIRRGVPSFRVGVRREERADVMIEVSAAAARRLNALRSADPAYSAAIDRDLRQGALRIEGDLSPFAAWFGEIHDQIVDRTA